MENKLINFNFKKKIILFNKRKYKKFLPSFSNFFLKINFFLSVLVNLKIVTKFQSHTYMICWVIKCIFFLYFYYKIIL